jgi:hypothetical protein
MANLLRLFVLLLRVNQARLKKPKKRKGKGGGGAAAEELAPPPSEEPRRAVQLFMEFKRYVFDPEKKLRQDP